MSEDIKQSGGQASPSLDCSAIGPQLVAARTECGLSQGEIATRLGWSQGWVSKFERMPDSQMKILSLHAYLKVLGESWRIVRIGDDFQVYRQNDPAQAPRGASPETTE